MIFILCFLGGLVILLLGIFSISKSFESYQSAKLKTLLRVFTDTPTRGFIFGTISTMILHSSSTITVLTIGLVNARILTFYQAIGIILGTNVGTTFDTQLIAFNLDKYLFFIILFGLIFFAMPVKKTKIIGKVFISFSFILIGLKLMTWSSTPLEQSKFFSIMWPKIDNNIGYAVLVGLISTALLQSSSAVTAILLALAPHEYLTLKTAVAVILGSNIGTCFTGLLAVIHSSHNARKVALAHIILNVGGLILFYPFISIFCFLLEFTSSSLVRQIANAQTFYNLISSLIVLPFAKDFANFTTWTYSKIRKVI